MNRISLFAATVLIAVSAQSQRLEKIKYGDFNQWVTRTIHESAVIGGHDKTIYEIGPAATIDGNRLITLPEDRLGLRAMSMPKYQV